MSDYLKLRRAAHVLSALFIAFIAAIWQISVMRLAYVDHYACIENAGDISIGSAPGVLRIGEMPINVLLSTLLGAVGLSDILLIPFLYVAFIPVLVPIFRIHITDELKPYFWATATLFCVVLVGTGLPANLHDCDFKGPDAEFRVFSMQIVYFLVSFVLTILARSSARNSDLVDPK